MNPNQAAAFCIARRGVLSREAMAGQMKRRKRAGDWVDLHARPERLAGLLCKAGLACLPIAVLKVKKSKTGVSKVVNQGEQASTPTSSPRRRSMPLARRSAERALSLALGGSRRLWPQRLKAAAIPHAVRDVRAKAAPEVGGEDVWGGGQLASPLVESSSGMAGFQLVK